MSLIEELKELKVKYSLVSRCEEHRKNAELIQKTIDELEKLYALHNSLLFNKFNIKKEVIKEKVRFKKWEDYRRK